MQKKVDTDLIIAFIDGKLDKEMRKEVRSYIDNDNDWFLEYIDLKQANFDIGGNESVQSAMDPAALENARLSSDNISSNSNWKLFFASLSAPFAALAPQLSLGIVASIILGSFYFLMPSTDPNYGNAPSHTREVFETAYSKIEHTNDEIIVVNKKSSGESYIISITFPDLMTDPNDFSYLTNFGYLRTLYSGSKIIISFDDIYAHYNNDLKDLENTSDLKLRVFIFDQNDQEIQNELIVR